MSEILYSFIKGEAEVCVPVMGEEAEARPLPPLCYPSTLQVF